MSIADTIATPEEYPWPEASILEFQIPPTHSPLGCTVEESLAPSDNDDLPPFVFVSRVTEDGMAETAGLAVGDVVVGVSSMFDYGKVDMVTYAGLKHVQALVAGRSAEEPLTIRVARGTNVLQEHEAALVEVCSDLSTSDQDIEECVTTFMASTFEEPTVTDEVDCSVDDDDSDCMVDSLYSMWADDMPTPEPSTQAMEDTAPIPTNNKVKPWSSRSSPSGTFVRDPVTGQMKNIDS